MSRLEHVPTLRIDAGEPVPFTFCRRALSGARGDSVATALYANGVRIFSRSLKYHRPRGLYSLDGESANTMMRVDGVPNLMAETTLLRAGMNVEAQNVKGSIERDWLRVLDKMDSAMPAGFYYRTMHKPTAVWPLAARFVRKMAGLGTLDPGFELRGHHEELFPNADVCVIGGGPAGMQAALAAAQEGLRTILLERRPWLGGAFEHRKREFGDGKPSYQRVRDLAGEVAATDVRVFLNTAIIGTYNDNLVTAFQVGVETDSFDERYIEIRARSIVVATGCIERPLLFDNNERPGVMQVGCAHRLAHTYGLLPGTRAVFSIGHDLGLECASDLADLGIRVACVADIRQDGQDPEVVGRLEDRSIPLLRGWVATEAQGKPVVEGVKLRSLSGTDFRIEACDLMVASAGMTPLTAPVTMAGGTISYDAHTGYFLPDRLPPRIHVAGRLSGLEDLNAIEESGRQAGLRAAADCGADVDAAVKEGAAALCALPGAVPGCGWVADPGPGRKTFICFDEDATVKNVVQSVQQGLEVPELIKRFASVGTGPGQGGIPGHNLPLFVAEHRNLPKESIKPTTVRGPMVPVSMATLAGVNHDMSKRTPVYESQKKPGAIVRRIGVWQRVRYFSSDLTCRKEVENVRTNVGMLDASTLGKFRLWGSNALDALQRVYVSDMSKLKPGRIRYSAMCNDDGCLVDDGVVVKLGENEYYLTTSTGRADQTIEWFRYHTRFDNWDFNLVNLTDAFGTINLAGPNARKVLEKLTDADVSNEALPFSGYNELTIKDVIPARVMRLGFVGELSFELHMPASYMQSVWDLLEEAGAEFGIGDFGVEAQNIMRMEKGHVIIGSESEQRTTLHDLGLGFLWSRKKPEAKSVGAVALAQTEDQEGRLKLVGIRMDKPPDTPQDGSIIVDDRIRGWVCIARFSITLGQSVGMALVEEPLAKEGTRLKVFEPGCGGRLKSAQVVPMPFYDPEGKRMKM